MKIHHSPHRFPGLIALLLLLLPFGSISALAQVSNIEPSPPAPEAPPALKAPPGLEAPHSPYSIASPLSQSANISSPINWYRYQGEWNGGCTTLNADTGPAAVAMAIHFSMNRWVPVNQVRAFMGGGCFKLSNHDSIRAALQHWGISFTEISGADAVRDAVNNRGHIVIVPAYMPDIGLGSDYLQAYSEPTVNRNVYKDPGGHWLVVKGFTSDGNWAITYDPNVFDGNGVYWYSNQAQKGKDRRYDFNQLRTAMTNMTNTAFEILHNPPSNNVSGTVFDEDTQNSVGGAKVFLSDGLYRSSAVPSGTNGNYRMTVPLRYETAFVIGIKGNKVGAVSYSPVSQQLRLFPSITGGIVLPESGRVKATFVSTDATSCSGNFSLYSPYPENIIQDYLSFGGISYPLEGLFDAGTELIFALTPEGVCAGGTFLSNDPTRAVITQPISNTWIIGWEDYQDSDFNDLVVRIDLEPGRRPSLKPPVAGFLHTIPAGVSNQAIADVVELLPPVDAFMDHKYPAASPSLANLYPYSVTFLGDDTSEAYIGAQPTQSYNGNDGTDFRLNTGTPVLAAAAGTVAQAGLASIYCPLDGSSKQANTVKVQHESGYSTEYWWLQSISSGISPGVSVTRSSAQPLGASGINGCTGKAGLHFVVRNPSGNLVDPFGWKPRLGSPWHAVKDPWQDYNADLGQDAVSYPLWDVPLSGSRWFDPGVATAFTSPLGISHISFPGSAYNAPVRITFTEKESNTIIQGKESWYFFDMVAYTQGDTPVSNLLEAASLEITLDPSKIPAGAPIYLYTWDLYSLDTAFWKLVPSTWNPATGQIQASISQLGIFAVTSEFLAPPPPNSKKVNYLSIIQR